MATRVMKLYFWLGHDADFPIADPASAAVFSTYMYGHGSPLSALYPEVPARNVCADYKQGIRELSAAGTVLLKHVNEALSTLAEGLALFDTPILLALLMHYHCLRLQNKEVRVRVVHLKLRLSLLPDVSTSQHCRSYHDTICLDYDVPTSFVSSYEGPCETHYVKFSGAGMLSTLVVRL